MTPSFIGRMATMLPGVRPSISLASAPTASTRLVTVLTATIDGSRTMIPLPRAKTSVFAVPRSTARSLEKIEKTDLKAKGPPTAGKRETRNEKRKSGSSCFSFSVFRFPFPALERLHNPFHGFTRLVARRIHCLHHERRIPFPIDRDRLAEGAVRLLPQDD